MLRQSFRSTGRRGKPGGIVVPLLLILFFSCSCLGWMIVPSYLSASSSAVTGSSWRRRKKTKEALFSLLQFSSSSARTTATSTRLLMATVEESSSSNSLSSEFTGGPDDTSSIKREAEVNHLKKTEKKAPATSGEDGPGPRRNIGILRVDGPDARGIVAAFSQTLYGHGCGIVESEQHTDYACERFFQRIVFDYSDMHTDRGEIRDDTVTAKHRLYWLQAS